MSIENVQSYYDNIVEEEIIRLDESWLEHDVTRFWLDRMLEESAEILDLGGGPGRYAFELAAMGHRVTLADLSSENLKAAQKEEERLGVVLQDILQIDARDLSQFEPNTFDCVLCLGPIYHLVADPDRKRALSEVFRVLRPGGTAFIGFLSRFATFHYFAKHQPDAPLSRVEILKNVLEHGLVDPLSDADFFTEARFDHPESIVGIVSEVGFENITLFGAEGGLAQSESRLKALKEKEKNEWRKIAIELSATKMAIFGSEHIVAIGRRPNDRAWDTE